MLIVPDFVTLPRLKEGRGQKKRYQKNEPKYKNMFFFCALFFPTMCPVYIIHKDSLDCVLMEFVVKSLLYERSSVGFSILK